MQITVLWVYIVLLLVGGGIGPPLIGLLLGVVGKFSICVMMIALFATNTIYRTLNQAAPTGQPAPNAAELQPVRLASVSGESNR